MHVFYFTNLEIEDKIKKIKNGIYANICGNFLQLCFLLWSIYLLYSHFKCFYDLVNIYLPPPKQNLIHVATTTYVFTVNYYIVLHSDFNSSSINPWQYIQHVLHSMIRPPSTDAHAWMFIGIYMKNFSSHLVWLSMYLFIAFKYKENAAQSIPVYICQVYSYISICFTFFCRALTFLQMRQIEANSSK